MAARINIKPEMIRWARERAQFDDDAMQSQIVMRALEWENSQNKPTLPQLNEFARKAMVPFGYLFLDSPPKEKIPLADFRTFDDKTPHRPSPNLLDTIYKMQFRQEWMRENCLADEIPPVEFVGLLSGKESIEEAALKICEELQLGREWFIDHQKRFNLLRDAADRAGVLVFLNSRFGFGKRKLNHEEFRGFTLIDDYAPLVFVNTNDTETAQLFTLAHELVHIALGQQSGLFNLRDLHSVKKSAEKRCSQIAAELLVPSTFFIERWNAAPQEEQIYYLASYYKVSPLVIARRALDHALISKERFYVFLQRDAEEWERLKFIREKKHQEGKKKGGPNFYKLLFLQLPPRFYKTVIEAARCGALLHHDAFDLIGVNGSTFREFARRAGEEAND